MTRDFDKEPALPRFSLDRRITVLMIAVTVAVVGTIAALSIPAEMIPSGWVGSMLFVQVPWQDAPPREVLDKITIPVEEELSTVKGIDKITSVSFPGMSQVFIRFKQNSDMSVAYREVRDRVQRARIDFPADADRVFIRKNSSSGFPVFMIGIAVDPDLEDPWDLIQNDVIIPVERLDGVATVEVFGLEEKEILIELDREKANAAGLNIYELAQDLGSDNFTMASGTVITGTRKLLLRSIASYSTVEQLENRLVGLSTRLKDVARITYEEPDKEYRARINGSPAVAVQVIKESQANTREVTRRLDALVEELKENPRLAGLELESFFDQGEIIDESLGTLIKSGAFGGALACAVLFFFMRRVRLTLIVAFSIPISLVFGLTIMYFAGETLNILTLIGLMICVGLLVDNSVVVAENIHRLRREGLPRREACIQGAGEVALAITMSTLTTVIVFLPAALIEGPMGFFLMRMALPVAVSVSGSLVVALVFIPLCVYLTLSRRETLSAAPSRFDVLHQRFNRFLLGAYERTFGKLNDAYNRLLEVSLERRFGLILGVIAVLLVSVNVYNATTKFVGQQDEEQAQFNIQFDLPPGMTLDDAADYFNEVEQVMEAHREETGLEGFFIYHEDGFGQMDAWFYKDLKNKPTVKESMKMYVEAFPEKPGVEVFTGTEQQGSDEKKQIAKVFVRGEDPDKVTQVVNQLAPLFGQVEGVLGQKKTGAQIPNELGLVVDREKAQHLNVNPQIIAGVVGYALRGQALPKFHTEGREVPVRVRFAEEDRESLTELNSFQVPTQTGEMLPLSALTSTRVLPESTVIVRRDKMIGRTITLELEEGKEDETRGRIAMLQANIDLPEGISFGGDTRRTQDLNDDLAGIQFALTLSIVFIYLLMGFLFESFILPLSILVTIPLSSIGMMWGHILTGKDLDFFGGVALILLIGIVVNNGIVLVDYINRLRARGHERKEAILMATHRRFRPIMMTAITTIGGMIPLALAGANSIGLSYTSFSLTLIGGMITATLLTLLVVPAFYTIFDDLRLIMAAAISPKRAAHEAPAATPEVSAAT
ncbi:MAG: MMPL family transporter [Acidobacteria bacterium]|nr:MMPL family transporter [Acidobacteriota bacterium]NIM63720.1 MMPL family transporter [Acidobacteriota bacterium]NIO60105.1 MMPL family transporter [Acidobacteriota bacterium]NIQ31176.1 MMPL family transporter [Acidobacteriota bacterium]NIQ86305.1 MMPL family transporter [Acidobacteriota bacterium]